MFRLKAGFFPFLCLTASVIGSFPVNAADALRPPFAIPQRLGEITDYWRPNKSATPNLDHQQLLVLIQDLHANVGVQKNIAAMLYRLNRMNKDRGLVVCVEGASGEGDVSLLRSLPRPIRHGFEEMLLHRAYLTGAELAATEASADIFQQHNVLWSRIKAFFGVSVPTPPVSLSPIHLWGVDDPELYRKNWKAAKKVDQQRNEALSYLRPTKSFVWEGAYPALQKHLMLLVKLLMLRLQPDEYKEYLKNRSLNPSGPPVYQQTIQAAETYYQAADQRSYAMTKNLLQRMGSSPGVTVLITGGFHTRQISSLVKDRGLSYAVITPRVEVLDQDQAYRARLREEE